jgi:hypothetical protein
MQRYTRLRMELEELRNDLDAMSAEVIKCSLLLTNTASHLKPYIRTVRVVNFHLSEAALLLLQL